MPTSAKIDEAKKIDGLKQRSVDLLFHPSWKKPPSTTGIGAKNHDAKPTAGMDINDHLQLIDQIIKRQSAPQVVLRLRGGGGGDEIDPNKLKIAEALLLWRRDDLQQPRDPNVPTGQQMVAALEALARVTNPSDNFEDPVSFGPDLIASVTGRPVWVYPPADTTNPEQINHDLSGRPLTGEPIYLQRNSQGGYIGGALPTRGGDKPEFVGQRANLFAAAAQSMNAGRQRANTRDVEAAPLTAESVRSDTEAYMSANFRQMATTIAQPMSLFERAPEPNLPGSELGALARQQLRQGFPADNQRNAQVAHLAAAARGLMGNANILHFDTSKGRKNLYHAYANDLSARRGGKYTVADAESQFRLNSSRGFTTAMDETWFDGERGPHNEMDALHEMLHILAAPGGEGRFFQVFGSHLNEATTQFFTETVATHMGDITPQPAYTETTPIARELAEVQGFEAMARANFLGDVSGLLRGMVGTYRQIMDAGVFYDGTRVRPSERNANLSDLDVANFLLNGIKKNMTSESGRLWIRQRIKPPSDETIRLNAKIAKPKPKPTERGNPFKKDGLFKELLSNKTTKPSDAQNGLGGLFKELLSNKTTKPSDVRNGGGGFLKELESRQASKLSSTNPESSSLPRGVGRRGRPSNVEDTFTMDGAQYNRHHTATDGVNNCLIHAIAGSLGLTVTPERANEIRAQIRQIDENVTENSALAADDRAHVEAILRGLGQNPADFNLRVFTTYPQLPEANSATTPFNNGAARTLLIHLEQFDDGGHFEYATPQKRSTVGIGKTSKQPKTTDQDGKPTTKPGQKGSPTDDSDASKKKKPEQKGSPTDDSDASKKKRPGQGGLPADDSDASKKKKKPGQPDNRKI